MEMSQRNPSYNYYIIIRTFKQKKKRPTSAHFKKKKGKVVYKPSSWGVEHSQAQWCTPIILALGKTTASLSYISTIFEEIHKFLLSFIVTQLSM
jgi:hypothetical protein